MAPSIGRADRSRPWPQAVYTWPSKNALAAVKATVHALTRAGSNQPLAALLDYLNQVLRGWTAYFRHGVSKRTFDYRELGKLPRTAPDGLILLLGGHGH